MSDTVNQIDAKEREDQVQAWKRLSQARADFDNAAQNSSQKEGQALFDELNDSLDRFMTMPASLDWIIRAKFRLYEEEILESMSDFKNYRQLVWFAAIKADVMRHVK
ncbi:hypothetical protein [Parvularcula sp. IMCC14364]|uniref:hypothetical protein n=1 Tax=Parvularcula sp. IMCC14364 TaxID=3067902 RepID=UPI002741657E|nr:hypothetical protein [Parvularcula sp. IMCC14364]